MMYVNCSFTYAFIAAIIGTFALKVIAAIAKASDNEHSFFIDAHAFPSPSTLLISESFVSKHPSFQASFSSMTIYHRH